MNTVARLLPLIGTVVISGVFAADPVVSESDEPPSQPAAAAPSQTGEQPPAVAPTGPSTMRAATPDQASSGKPDNAQPVANKPARKVLVDDTVTDAQLKQILRKGYKPESQARGNEVFYCRSESELGSRFQMKVCRTATRILEEERQGKDVTTEVQRPSGNRPSR